VSGKGRAQPWPVAERAAYRS